MPEGNINAEFAQHLREHAEHDEPDEPTGHKPSRRRVETIEILEAIFLAIVAISTALSGFQAALWDGESAKEYATSSRMRVEATNASLTSNQQLIYNSSTFTAWLQAYNAKDKQLMTLLERRYLPNYKKAFDQWVKLAPWTAPGTPAGPRYMPGYTDPLAEKAAELNKEASHAFDLGVENRGTGEDYVRVTVILAAVLFLIAIGQRFKIRGVRYSVNIIAGVFLVYALILIATYPHLYTA
jgi:hypothetical protein